MELKEAIEVLKEHNHWRRFDGKIDESPKMTDPKKLGIAIDTVVSEFESLFICGVVGRSEQLPCDHEFTHKPLGGNVYCWKCCALQTK